MNPDFVTIRSLIVLLFLVGLPIVAIMPDGVQGALRGFWPEPTQATAHKPLSPTLGGYSSAPVQETHLAPVTSLADWQRSGSPAEQAPTSLAPPSTQPPAVRPANFELPARTSLAGDDVPYLPAGPPTNDPIDQLPLPSDRLTAPTASPAEGRAALVTQETEQLQDELDRLGATYYRLESWGDGPRVYRFHCTVTITIGLAEYSRRFEATAQHPQQAMRQVLGEVEAWHDRFPSATSSERPGGE